jgi:hypothetical protein
MNTTYNRVVPRNGKEHHVKPNEMGHDKLMRWAQDHHLLLRACDPKVPGPYNRKTDTWRLVVAIGELAGGRWPRRVKAVVASLADRADGKESYGVLLLGDIRRIFKRTKQDRLASSYLVKHLVRRPHRPWSAFNHDQPLFGASLSPNVMPLWYRPCHSARRQCDLQGV